MRPKGPQWGERHLLLSWAKAGKTQIQVVGVKREERRLLLSWAKAGNDSKKGEVKLREAKATTLGIVLHARSCAMGGEAVVGEVKGVEEVGV